MKKQPIILALMTLTCSSLLYAQSDLLSDDFESYIEAEVPANPADGNPNDWYVYSGMVVEIELAASPNGNGNNEKVLNIHKSDESGKIARIGRRFESQTSGNLQLDLKFQIHDFARSNVNLQIGDFTPTLGIIDVVLDFRITTTGNFLVRHGSGSMTEIKNPQGGELMAEDWYQLTVVANLDEKTFSVTIVNLNDPEQSGTLSNLEFLTDTSVFNAFRLNSSEAAKNTELNWSIDDVKISTVSEP